MVGRTSQQANLRNGIGNAPSPTVGPRRRRSILAGGLLAAMTVVAYWPATQCGYVWDDDDYVLQNQTLRSTDGLRQIWFEIGATHQYYPMVHTSYWLEYRLWKLDPTGYHVVNILLHVAGAVLLWRILVLLQVPGAWAAAAVFALHPVHVESVAWITERKNVLSGVFYLGSALAFLRYALAPRNASDRTEAGRLYAASLVLFLGALLSKTVTCTLPAALVLLLWWKRGRVSRSDLRALAPFLALGVVLGLLTVWMERNRVGAAGEEWDLSFVDRCLIAGRALCFYVGKLFRPGQLTFIYPRWEIDARAWQQVLYPVAAAAGMVALWLTRTRIGRGPLAAVLFFASALFPALGFFDVYPMRYSFVADHFQYLASLGLITLVAAAGGLAANRLGVWGKTVAGTLLALVLVTFGTLTWRQTHAYMNLETLWRDTLRKNPDAWLAHNNLGTVLQSQGKLDEAIRHYHRALQLKPDYALAYNNVGNVLRLRGMADEAITYHREAVRLKPDFVEAHDSLGTALRSQGKLDEAVSHFRQAVRFKPDYVPSHYNLGNALKSQGKLDEAISHYRKAVQFKPDFAEAQNNLGVALIMTGRADEALSRFREAARLDPDWEKPLVSAAWILATHPDSEVRDEDEAIRFAERASELTRHQDALVLDTLAAAYASTGQFDQAVTTARDALSLAVAAHAGEQAELIRRRLVLYKRAIPYREPIQARDSIHPPPE